ncbi:E3 ubiquitin-protein ligase TRIM39-like [Carettochelys insculpta]|uniref:E3 ubiquitin-protein ligase TRIM39-like n=1 Tax=Carettochelys insculpta TaxID=44489 RepID=UPI003EBB486F
MESSVCLFPAWQTPAAPWHSLITSGLDVEPGLAGCQNRLSKTLGQRHWAGMGFTASAWRPTPSLHSQAGKRKLTPFCSPWAAMKPGLRRCPGPVCSSCQGPFKLPVTFKGCEHKFCRFCATPFKRASGPATSCPLCHQASLQAEHKPHGPASEEGDEAEKASLEVGGEPEPVLECEEHQAALELFCTEEESPICQSCRASGAHRTHTVVPLEEAAQEYKGKLQTVVEMLKQQSLEAWVLEYQEGKKAAEWKEKTHYQRMRLESEFEKMHEYLAKEEEQLLRKLRKEEKDTLKKLHGNIKTLSEQHASLRQLIKEVEERCHQPAAKLLKDVKDTLTRSENIQVQEPEAVFAELENIYNIPSIDIIDLLRKFTVDMTLEPDTAHPNLILSEDRRSVAHGDMRLELPNNPQRFDPYVMVLGSRRFTGGKSYWEVEVGDKVEWDVGVCRESVGRKGQVILSPSNGFWRVWLRNGDKYKALNSRPALLTVSVQPSRVGIFLDYKAGEISFYNVSGRTHLYSYSGAFYGALRPFFSPGLHRGGANASPLTVCPKRQGELVQQLKMCT